jgi:phage protein D
MLKPSLRLFLEESDISNDILEDLIDLEYNNEGDNASSLRIIVRSSPRLFNSNWMPKPLQYIKCEIFYEGDSAKLNAGNFQVESVREKAGNSYDVIEISAISVPIVGRIFERKNLSFSNIPLETVLRDKALGLNLKAQIKVPELFVNLEQQEQSDLEFLRMVAGSWGLSFTIDNGTLVMAGDSYFRSIPPILTMGRSEYRELDLEHTGYNTYSDCEVSYTWLGENKSLIVKDWAVFSDNLISLRPSRRLRHEMKFPVVSPYHAAYVGVEQLVRKNNGQISGSMASIGRPELVALNNIKLEGNRFNGNYQIMQATHRFNTDRGWSCNCKLKWIPVRVGEIQFNWYDMLEIARGSIGGFGIDIPGIPGI